MELNALRVEFFDWMELQLEAADGVDPRDMGLVGEVFVLACTWCFCALWFTVTDWGLTRAAGVDGREVGVRDLPPLLGGGVLHRWI